MSANAWLALEIARWVVAGMGIGFIICGICIMVKEHYGSPKR